MNTTDYPSRHVQITQPLDWAQDKLTAFFEHCRQQQAATFVNTRTIAQLAIDIDSLLADRVGQVFCEPSQQEFHSCRLTMRGLSAYRTSAQLAFSAQIVESLVIVRNVLECALYAWAVRNNDNVREAWAHREDGDEQRKAARRALQQGTLAARLSETDRELGERFRVLYDQVIDFGAHPNVGGIDFGSLLSTRGDGQSVFSTVFTSDDLDSIVATMFNVIDAGLIWHHLSALTYPDRYRRHGLIDGISGLEKRFLQHAERFARAHAQRSQLGRDC